MKWRKLGHLFNPADHQLPSGCLGFAQSPQALVYDDFVRIYFSTRTRDAGGYVSHIAFVDVDKQMQRVLRTSAEVALGPGQLGTFDEHGIFPINVVRHEGGIRAYTCGWSRRVAVPVETAIGAAVSDDDGMTFRRLGPGPIMGPALNEPVLVGDPFVLVHGGRWHMWYIFGTGWKESPGDPGPARVYKIAYAVSHDGLSWSRSGEAIISDRIGEDECQALPTVLFCDGEWHMYFCYRAATDFRTNRSRGYRLGYARSRDMQTWQRDDGSAGIDVSPSGWDSDMLCYPHVFWCDGRAYLLYNGNAFGRDGFGVAILER